MTGCPSFLLVLALCFNWLGSKFGVHAVCLFSASLDAQVNAFLGYTLHYMWPEVVHAW